MNSKFAVFALLLATGCVHAEGPRESSHRPVGTTERDFDFTKNGPRQLLFFLQNSADLNDGAHRLRVERPMVKWISEADIPYLISQLNSSAPCMAVNLSTSSFLPTRVTVGDMAAYLIDSYRSRIFPKSLYARTYTQDEKDEIEGWWERFSDADRLSRGD